MDDFLHNLRSGKLKHTERSRQYNDQQYKGGQRRNLMRKRDQSTKESTERLEAIKETLENIAKTQERMAKAYETRIQAEERKARAMEVLAKNLYQMLNPEADDVDKLFAPLAIELAPITPTQADATESDSETKTKTTNLGSIEKSGSSDNDQDVATMIAKNIPSEKLTDKDRQTLYKMICTMRDEGQTWKKIARHIADKGYPTASGKGSWRGAMAKALYDKMTGQ